MDRGETRVAILEAEGDPAPRAESGDKKPSGGRRRGGKPSQQKREELNGSHVAELYIERRGSRSIVGNIYKGKVDNVLPGLEAAFVDIGLDKNGFLHADDIVMPGVEVARRGRGGKGQRITELLKPGQEIVVQVMKDPLKTKGARLTMQLSIAGRYLVYVPQGEGVGVSRRLEDKERDRLRKQASKLDLGKGGAIIRTAARGADRADRARRRAQAPMTPMTCRPVTSASTRQTPPPIRRITDRCTLASRARPTSAPSAETVASAMNAPTNTEKGSW